MKSSDVGWIRRACCAALVLAMPGVASSAWAQTPLQPLQVTVNPGTTRCTADGVSSVSQTDWKTSTDGAVGCGTDVGETHGTFSTSPVSGIVAASGSMILDAVKLTGSASGFTFGQSTGVFGLDSASVQVENKHGPVVSVFNPNPYDLQLRVLVDFYGYAARGNVQAGFPGSASTYGVSMSQADAIKEVTIHTEFGPTACVQHVKRQISRFPNPPTSVDPRLDPPEISDVQEFDNFPPASFCQAATTVPANATLILPALCGFGSQDIIDSDAYGESKFWGYGPDDNEIYRSGYGLFSARQTCELMLPGTTTAIAPATLEVTAHSPIDLLVTDADGNRVGFDLEREQIVDEIAGAQYTGHGTEPQTIVIPHPSSGDYSIRMVGTGNGSFHVTMRTLDRQGHELDVREVEGTATPGDDQILQVHVAPEGQLSIPGGPGTDTTPPATTATLSPQPNAAGWNRSDVTVTLAAIDDDGGSGVQASSYSVDGGPTLPYTVPFGIFGDGVHTIEFASVDKASNAEAPHSVTFRIDQMPPHIIGLRSPDPNASDWNNSAVTITFQCSDGLSGLAAGSPPSPTVVSAQGAGQSVTATCTDLAGNSAPLTVADINIDTTPPTLNAVALPPPNANGWSNTPVTVSFVASDSLSGVVGVSSPVTVSSEGGAQIVTGSATDRAGNTSAIQAILNMDRTPPEAYLQFNPATHDIVLIGRDALSGVGPGPVVPQSIVPVDRDRDDDDRDVHDNDGMRTQLRTYQVLDLAGNSLTLVAKARMNRHQLAVQVVSLKYGAGPLITLPRNRENFEWDVQDGRLTELDQSFNAGRGEEAPRVQAEFKSRRNLTTIDQQEPEPTRRLDRTGLVLLRLATSAGKLSIEY